MAATLETASKGLIYEHRSTSPVAARLTTALMSLLEEIRRQGGTVYDSEAAMVLRVIEHGAQESSSGADTYLRLMERLLRQAPRRKAEKPNQSPLVVL